MYIYLKNRVDVFWGEFGQKPSEVCPKLKKKKIYGRNWKKRGKKFIPKYC